MKKLALITGSSAGIGRQIGLDLLQSDYEVYFNGRNKSYPEDDHFIQADCSSYDSVNIIREKIHPKELDVLVLNVGTTDRTPLGCITPSNWLKVFDTNLNIPFFLVQALRPYINPNGRIVFITSISGSVPDSSSISYGVSKAAVNMLVKYLAKELAYKDITVNAIAPGYTMTNWHKTKPIEQIHRIAKKTALKRFGKVTEISQAVQMVIQNEYINGQIIQVDGGFGLV